MSAIYKIGSFNMHNLSLRTQRDFERIANIIKQNNLDIIALQEVLGGKLNPGLMNYLGSDWKCFVKGSNNHQTSKYPYSSFGNDSRDESFAFVWNTKRIELSRPTKVYRENPNILDSYHLRESFIRLIRDPLVGRFRLKNRNVEIRLITTHVVFGKPKDENLSVPVDYGTLTMRRNEFKILAGDIYSRVNDGYKSTDNVVPYTIILGDYNLNLAKSGIKKYTLPDVIFFDKKGISTTDPDKVDRAISTIQNDLTTIQKNKDGHARNGYASNYDHFSFDKRVKNDIFSDCYAIDAVHGNTMKMTPETYIAADNQPSSSDSPFDIYMKNVSDHLPIVIELNI